MDVTVWLCIIMCVVVSLLAPFIIRLLYGLQYAPSIILLQVCVFKVIGYAFAQVTAAMILIEKLQKYIAVRNMIGCLFAIVLNVILIPFLGVLGAAIASVVTSIVTGYLSHAVIPLYQHIFSKQTTSLVIGWKNFLRYLINSIKYVKKHHNNYITIKILISSTLYLPPFDNIIKGEILYIFLVFFRKK